MERKINNDLLKWRRDSINKPLFLYGSKCVGKTFSVLDFGKKYYKNIAYFDTDNNIELISIFEKEKVLTKLVAKLSFLCGETIFEDDTLIVFDNLESDNLMKDLKIFSNNNSKYQVIIISSNRVKINKLQIEEFYYRSMYNMDFFEYLSNTDKAQLIDFIKDSYETGNSMPFHQMALEAYYEYLVTGGFPEVVDAKINGKSDLEIEAIKQKIFDVYRSEYAKEDLALSVKCNEIMKVLPLELMKENKKFQYGVIRKGARSKEYENSIEYLVYNGIVHRSFRITDISKSLASMKDQESFKLYFNDAGILYSKMFLNKAKLLTDTDIRRALIENDVANSLTKHGFSLYYYQSDGKAEINFVIQNRAGKIIPIEVVNMKLTKAKAMSFFLSKYGFKDCIRLTEGNFSFKKGVKCIPVYAIACLNDL